MRRLALQIAGVRFLGYAGIQLTGIHSERQLGLLQTKVGEIEAWCDSLETWQRAWVECMSFPAGGKVSAAPREPWYMGSPPKRAKSKANLTKYRTMSLVHVYVFVKGPIAALFGKLMRPIKPRHGAADRVAERFEKAVKGPLFGCDTCGMCRLEATRYVCPETCPKGLSNGPCGGTQENLCEFRDRECIHSVKLLVLETGWKQFAQARL